MKKVINIIKKSEAEIPESVLDRAHRIVPTYTMIRGKKDAKHNYQIHYIWTYFITLFYTNCKKIECGA